MNRTFFLPWFLVVGCSLTSFGRDQSDLEGPWEQEAKEAGLSAADIVHLTKEKVLMSQQEIQQCFEAYLPRSMTSHGDELREGKDVPYFITTDSLLHAYAWCVQKAVARMEEAHAGQLRAYLDNALANVSKAADSITGDPALKAGAVEHSLFVVGVAAALMEVPLPEQPSSLINEINAEAARIRKASGSGLPRLLQSSIPSASQLDYRIFKPAGMYAGVKILEDYFRAVRWLQIVPFRSFSDKEALSAAILALAHHAHPLGKTMDSRAKRLSSLAGPPDRPSAWRCLDDTFKNKAPTTVEGLLQAVRHYLEAHSSDTITSALDDTSLPLHVSASVMPGSRLVDAVFIESLSRVRGERFLPEGISIAAWLGSTYAAGFDASDEASLRISRESGVLFSSDGPDQSLHACELRLLQKLFKSPSPNSPTFMKSRAWQAKSCQTALSAWAQARRIWTLQEQPHYAVGAGSTGWPAFVEPDPWFFVGLAQLCTRAGDLLANMETTAERRKRLARDLREKAEDLASLPLRAESRWSITESQLTTLEMLAMADVQEMFDSNDSKERCVKILLECADWIEKQPSGRRHVTASKILEQMEAQGVLPFDELAGVCTKLAALAQKQIRGDGPDRGDSKDLVYFGLTLAAFSDCHFTHPIDNVPKVARVFTNPATQKALNAGIGRPRFLYVLYPWAGREILCRGAVLPYLESQQMRTFTDEEWKASLHGPQAPSVPSWITPLTGK
jgi:hypothetical protein